MKTLQDIIDRITPPVAWHEGDNIPWNEPAFSRRMLEEHLTQEHDLASRKAELIEMQVEWIHETLLGGRPSRILDLACGPGLYLNQFGRLGHQGVGIDFSPASIGYARQVAARDCLAVIYAEQDLRTGDFGTGFDLVMLLYGQLNVFRREEATGIVRRAVKALKPGGVFVVEPQTHESVKNAGVARPTWSTHRAGLFSTNPHLLLTESIWDETESNATQRFFVIDARNGDVTLHAMTTEAYTEDELLVLLTGQGLSRVSILGSLTGDPGDGLLTALIGTLQDSEAT